MINRDSPLEIEADDSLYPALAEKLTPQPPPLVLTDIDSDSASSYLDWTTLEENDVTQATSGIKSIPLGTLYRQSAVCLPSR